jgi:alanyl-tRNA synthetase
MHAAEIRSSFLEFFTARDHQLVPSSPLVPADDPTLLFTNAGMVQFKRVFQGLERPDSARATTCQKCVRAGGKHNDLEQVGHTARHHTFFEMLGNFSFGDYFKKEAIEYAWEWVTGKNWLGISPKRLYVTVHYTDDEARKLWRHVAKVPDERIYGLGDQDNFWQMADTGPAGPNTEIYVDIRGKREAGSGKRELTQDQFMTLNEAGQLLEIWNLVFMQYDLQKDGSRLPLPAPSVDTGAGLERIAAVMQNVPSNFDTDVFTPIIERATEIVGRPYDRGPKGASFRVLADHARAVAFLLADGVYPSNEGRGYVLRRILRRAVRHAWLLGRREPTLVDLAGTVITQLESVYPELGRQRDHIAKVTRAEEERFFETIEGGLKRLDDLKGASVIAGDEAFKLYDTFGFPIDLTQLIAGERGQSVDLAGFERALEAQRDRSRGGDTGKTSDGAAVHIKRRGEWVTVKPDARQKWVGYETTRAETNVVAFRQAGEQLELVLEENPFYAESGGQVSDTGRVVGRGYELPVKEVEKIDGKNAVVGTFSETFEPTPVEAIVDEPRRRNIERNHTATHLVHAALRKVLGTHVRQAGSVVAPDRLRFDFSHHGPIPDKELSIIEEEVNTHVWENLPVLTRELPYREAISAGAMALFGEKYGDVVRVVDVPGVSLELCGGTHVATTGQIGLFRFTHETGAAAGVRRIEAVTGPVAYRQLRELEQRLNEAARLLKAQPEHLARRIEALLEQQKRLERQMEGIMRSGEGGGGGRGLVREQRISIGPDLTLISGTTEVQDRKQLASLIDGYREASPGTVAILVSGSSAHVGLSDDLVAKGFSAVEIAKALGGGRGGGRPHYATGVASPDADIGAIIKQYIS